MRFIFQCAARFSQRQKEKRRFFAFALHRARIHKKAMCILLFNFKPCTFFCLTMVYIHSNEQRLREAVATRRNKGAVIHFFLWHIFGSLNAPGMQNKEQIWNICIAKHEN